MLFRLVHTLIISGTTSFGAAQLSGKNDIESVNLFLGPLDACTHEQRWKTGLKCRDSVFDDGEVDKGQLPNVLMQVALENALPSTVNK
jgi:hypothetical protein